MINPIILLVVFLICTVVGYFIIRHVPSLLHTPLMSGMNALSGVTIVGSVTATGFALFSASSSLSVLITAQVLGMCAIILATINVVGGFGITHRMLQMFNKKHKK
jgi:NAD(P) transhydrogenase subunit alpha